MASPAMSATENSYDGRGILRVGTRVRQAGTENVYVVTRVDMARRLADIRPIAGPGRAHVNVPFECLRELAPQGRGPRSDP